MLTIVIPGEPCAQGRPRMARAGTGVRTYDPAKSASWKGAAAVWMRQAAGPKPPFGDAPVAMTVDAVFKRKHFTKKWSKGRIPRPSRPDGDNVLKAVQDAGNGVLFLDDAQVVDARVRKWYAAEGEAPQVVVTLEVASV